MEQRRPSHKKPCQRDLLAHRGICQVEICSCGMLHLSIGPVTLRLDTDGYRDILELLEETDRKLILREHVPNRQLC